MFLFIQKIYTYSIFYPNPSPTKASIHLPPGPRSLNFAHYPASFSI